MANIIANGGNIPPVVVSEMFNAVRGKSALAKISDRMPVAFNGSAEFVFNMDSEADIVAENGAKSNGGATATPIVIRPYKFEYGVRVSDEFLKGSEEYRMDVMREFAEGAARKFAKGMDIAAMHGLNPRTMTAATATVGNMHLDHEIPAASVISYTAGSEDANLNAAIAKVNGFGYDVTGVAFDPEFSSALGSAAVGNIAVAPEYLFCGDPDTFHGMKSAVNGTVGKVATGADKVYGYVGDFDAFRWGYARDVEFEVIEYGDPDNAGSDLKGHNQVYLRAEAYIGWAVLDGNAFAKIEA